uniref:EndoU domain-containing protein n=1 Tax=Kalanchoe fedtschenkoi TaxID=63787 RepID=A0A7N0V3I0_KALFE
MEGLIKGLVNVALGQDEDPREGRQERSSSSSSWAQVVSGDKDGDEDRRRTQRKNEGQQHDGEWEFAGSRPSRRPPHQDGYERNEGGGGGRQVYNQVQPNSKEEEDNDGWETVGKKPPRRQHKVQKDQWGGYKRPAGEQEYSEDVGVATDPSQEELSDLSQACSKLWELDLNRLVPGKDYIIDCGEGKKVYQRGDMAEGSLFSWLSDEVFRKPTYARFCSLLDNYNPNEGSKEVVTEEERQEQAAFIEEISRTAPIKYLYKYLSEKRVVSGSFEDFKRRLESLWFDLYGRGGSHSSSSAFEHVFVGEIKNRQEQEVSGFHNWIQFYLEEAKGRVDYQGYIFPRRRGQIPDSETQLLTVQFEWNGVLKSVSSTLVGVSPEFEVALYTLCFFLGGEDNHVQLGPYDVNVKCYRFGNRIGSVFPIAET